MNASLVGLTLHFSPLLPTAAFIALGVASTILLGAALTRPRKSIIWRVLCVFLFLLVLSNPCLLEEDRKPVANVAVIVLDKSVSQQTGLRSRRAAEALTYLENALEDRNNLDLRVVNAPDAVSALQNETRLFESLNQTLADVPESRRAGVIFLTDGQVHDVPADIESMDDYGPVHVLLTGRKDERDRQLVVLQAPAYGIVGQTVTVRYRIEEAGTKGNDIATVIVRRNAGEGETYSVPVNQDQTLDIPVEHGGQNIVEMEVSPLDDEISSVNNHAAFGINGVRDRLKVLLVSGQPHAGGRTWRNLLTSDPGVDLVHFTILREPEKLDATPQNELSLIAFPYRELFEIKLFDFDLIIFDQYRLNNILPTYYFANIARYVREGGALLEASGPTFAGKQSVYETALNTVLPARPDGRVISQSFKPEVTAIGKNHPVTMGLQRGGWGPWLRQIGIHPTGGDVVMTGVNEAPLLVLSHVGKGRVAQLASDQIWLWSRGYEGGGPQGELLRRLAHWLMKEPELDENALEAIADEGSILIRRRSLKGNTKDIEVTLPDGTTKTLTLSREEGDPWMQARLEADQLGVYGFDDKTQRRFAVVGSLDAPELTGMITTDKILRPIAETSSGSVKWLENTPRPDIRFLPPDRKYGGASWIGLRENRDYTVSSVREIPLLPFWAGLLLLLTAIAWGWWREGKSG